MREYLVPFSTKEETPFIFNLSIREMIWIGVGLFIGLMIFIAVLFMIGPSLQKIVFCIPIIVPFSILGFYLSRKKVTEDDHEVTLDRHIMATFKYRFRNHNYINYRVR